MGRTPSLPPEPSTEPRPRRLGWFWSLPPRRSACVLLVDSIWQSSATYDEVDVPARRRAMVANRRADPDHADGLAPVVLEAPAGPGALGSRPAWPGRADRRPDRPSGRAPAAGPRRGAVDLARRAGARGRLEQAALRSPGHGPRGLALRPQPEPDCPRRPGHDGAARAGLPPRACFFSSGFLTSGRRRWLWASAAVGGLAFSCKYTTVLIPPILAVVWWFASWRQRGESGAGTGPDHERVVLGMTGYVLVMIAGERGGDRVRVRAAQPIDGASIPASTARLGGRFAPWIARSMKHPMPQDWVGFATQMHHQMSGGPSYLLGERRHDRLASLLLRGACREGAADLLAPARRPRWRWRRAAKADRDRLTMRSCPGRSACSWPSRHSARRAITGSVTCFRLRHWQSSGSRAWPRKPRVSLRMAVGWPAWIVGMGWPGRPWPWRAFTPSS